MHVPPCLGTCVPRLGYFALALSLAAIPGCEVQMNQCHGGMTKLTGPGSYDMATCGVHSIATVVLIGNDYWMQCSCPKTEPAELAEPEEATQPIVEERR